MVQGRWTPTKPRAPIAAEFQTPGPGYCDIPSLIGQETPKFTMSGRPEHKEGTTSPSPSDYNTRKLTSRGRDESPQISMAGRARENRPYITPAPCSYEPHDQVLNESPPHYSFGRKLDTAQPSNVPAPNAYSVPKVVNERSAPKFSIVGRGRIPGDERHRYPSPADYADGQCQLDAVKPRQPAFSLRQRTQIPSDSTQKPGPNAYTPDKQVVKKRMPQYSFGVKHSQYTGAFKGDTADPVDIQQGPARRGAPTTTQRTNSSSYSRTQAGFAGREVVRVSAEGVTCRWVDRVAQRVL